MKILAITTLAVVALASCTSSSSGGPVGSGGVGSGGASSGGGSGSGGKTGTGGNSALGGTTSTGGSSASGGSSAAGGVTSSGGTSAGGGSTGTGGNTGAGGTKSPDGAAGGAGGRSDAGPGDATGAGGKGTGGTTGDGGAATGGAGGSGGAATDGGSKDLGGAGGGVDGGSGSYAPCPTNGDACKILPLGDSITYGINYGGGYRIKLFTHTSTDSKNVTFVGYDTGNPPDSTALSKLGSASSKWVGKHEGHSGWTIQQDDDLVTGKSTAVNSAGDGGTNYAGKKVVADFGPNIVLVHLGTNDLNLGQASGAPDRLGTLIDHIVADAPDALVVVAKIIPLPSQASGVTTFNNAIPGVVKQRADAGKHVIVVDQFTGMIANTDMDSVHPKESGYEKMAVVWYNAIKSYLH